MSYEKNVKVFISSTFKDMHSERDYLVKFVFPTLRAKALKLGIHLLDMDLRWGVTKEEAEDGKALEICLDEIDHARPFFIGILGDRYGWIPDQYQVPNIEKYEWIESVPKGKSITELEILHGILNNEKMIKNSFFLFRNTDSQIPQSIKDLIIEKDKENQNKLENLKQRIETYYNLTSEKHIFHYDSNFRGLHFNIEQLKHSTNIEQLKLLSYIDEDGIVSSDKLMQCNQEIHDMLIQIGQPYFDELEQFGDWIEHVLWEALVNEYGDDSEIVDEILQETKIHEQFAKERTHYFLGRDTLISQIQTFLEIDNQHPIMLYGQSGTGKSSVMSKIFLSLSHSYDTIIAFCGLTQMTGTIYHLLGYLITKLNSTINLEIYNNIDDRIKLFQDCINQISMDKKTIILIDGLDVLANQNDVINLSTWLPINVPLHVKLILSTASLPIFNYANKIDYQKIVLDPLDKEDAKVLVVSILNEYRKKLNHDQLNRLMIIKQITTPLYAVAVAQFMRVFPRFEDIDALIDHLPDNVDELFELIINQLTYDFQTDLVFDVLSYLRLSIDGLIESEIIQLINKKRDAMIPLNHWVRFYRYISEYLTNIGESENGLIKPFHQQFAFAIDRIILDEKRKKQAYQELFEFSYELYMIQDEKLSNLMQYIGVYAANSGNNTYLDKLFKQVKFVSNIDIFYTVYNHLFEFYMDEDIPNDINHPIEIVLSLFKNETESLYPSKFLLFQTSNFIAIHKSLWASYLAEKFLSIAHEQKHITNEHFAIYLKSANLYANLLSINGETRKSIAVLEDANDAINDMKDKYVNLLGYANVRYNLAVHHNTMKNYDKSISYYFQAIENYETLYELEPDSFDVIYHLSLALTAIAIVYQRENPDLAFTYLKRSKDVILNFNDSKRSVLQLALLHTEDVITECKSIKDETYNPIDDWIKSMNTCKELMVKFPFIIEFQNKYYKHMENLMDMYIINEDLENLETICQVYDYEVNALMKIDPYNSKLRTMVITLENAKIRIAELLGDYHDASYHYQIMLKLLLSENYDDYELETKNYFVLKIMRNVLDLYYEKDIDPTYLNMDKIIIEYIGSMINLKIPSNCQLYISLIYWKLSLLYGTFNELVFFRLYFENGYGYFIENRKSMLFDIDLWQTSHKLTQLAFSLHAYDISYYAGLLILDSDQRWDEKQYYLSYAISTIQFFNQEADREHFIQSMTSNDIFHLIMIYFNVLDISIFYDYFESFSQILTYLNNLYKNLFLIDPSYKNYPLIIGNLFRFQSIYLLINEDDRWIESMEIAKVQLEYHMKNVPSESYAFECALFTQYYLCMTIKDDKIFIHALEETIRNCQNYLTKFPESHMVKELVSLISENFKQK